METDPFCQRSGLPKTTSFRVSHLYAAWVAHSVTCSVVRNMPRQDPSAVGCLQLLSALNPVQDMKLCPFDGRSVRVYRAILSRS